MSSQLPPDSNNPYASPQTPAMAQASEFVACPNCRQSTAERIKWTFWGGMLGPKLFTHVKCRNCGTKYNGKTGRSNDAAIAIYLVVSVLLGFAIAAVVMATALVFG